MHVNGYAEVLAALRNVRKEAGMRMEDAIGVCAATILRKSNYYVPVDTERLKKSGTIMTRDHGLHVKAFIIYDTWYAVFVHEILWYHHKPPTQAKFLERGRRETQPACARILNQAWTTGRSRTPPPAVAF